MRVIVLLAMMLAMGNMLPATVSAPRHPYVKHWKGSTFGIRWQVWPPAPGSHIYAIARGNGVAEGLVLASGWEQVSERTR